jgi:hypothetical protein
MTLHRSLYFRGPKEPNPKFEYEPKPEHMYTDFIQVMHSSGYKLTKSSIQYDKKGFVEIEVTGVK